MPLNFAPKLLPISALMLLLCGLNTPMAADTTAPKKFTILHTNDHHGRFWHNTDGELGMAARYTLLERIRKEVEAAGGSVLLLSGGDINTGVPESDMQDAEPDFVGMKALGYDAMALGNHEFDNPLSVLRHQQELAGFPFLSANIYAKDNGQRLFQPWQVFERSGLKVAVIGLTTEDTAKIGNPEYLDNIEFRDPKVEAKNLIVELQQKEKPDLIIAATHMGHYDNGQHGYNAPGDVTLARSLPEGALDVIIGGHTQEALCMTPEHVRNEDYQPGEPCVPDQQNGTWIMQAHEWGKYVGRADFEYADGKLKLVNYALIPINLKKKVKVGEETKKVFITEEIPQDKTIMALLGPYQQKGMEKITIKIGSVNKELVGKRDIVRFQQTNLGRLIATAQMEKSKADFGIMNAGGVRNSINEGTITYKEVLEVHPFGNTVAYVDMKGSELPVYLAGVATKPVDTGAFAQFANISMTVYPDRVEDIQIGGKPLDPEKTYRFSLPSFAAAGGDGYPKVSGHPGFVDTGFVDADVLREYIEQHNPLDANAFNPGQMIVYRSQ